MFQPTNNHMENTQLAMILTAMSDQTSALNRMADAMTGILLHLDPTQAAKMAAPGYKRRLAEYARFDWASIDATVTATDRHGATEVEYNGAVFTRRRSGEDDPKGDAIRFSRVVSGTPDAKNMVWANLIRFADPKAKDPPKPLRGELAERITEAQSKAPVAIAVAPALTEAQTAAQQWLDQIAAKRQTITVADARRANARGVALALASNLPAEFIDNHTSPSSENSGPAMLAHAEALLNAVIAGKAPEPVF